METVEGGRRAFRLESLAGHVLQARPLSWGGSPILIASFLLSTATVAVLAS